MKHKNRNAGSTLAPLTGSETETELRAQVKHLKGELAYMKLQRDRLLEITWLDGPAEPWESTQGWQEQFNKGWIRRAEVSESPNGALSNGGEAQP